jgi:hypothetical protein
LKGQIRRRNTGNNRGGGARRPIAAAPVWAPLQLPLDVYGQHVGFDVYRVAQGALAKRRGLQCMGNQRDAEAGVFDVDQRQAHSIDGNRPLGGHLPGQASGNGKPHRYPWPRFIAAVDAPDCVDVAGHQVAAQRIAQAERGLKVHLIADANAAQVGALERLGARLEG